MKGIFIVLEGPDGSGKSTIVNLLSDYLKKNNIDFIFTREPGGTDIGEEIRNIILDKHNSEMSPFTEALLYASSRAQHIHQKIKPALQQGKIVICDRFLFSSLAYQGVARGLGVEEVKKINDFALQHIYPDTILFFDVNPEICLRRKTNKNKGDRLELEGIKFHNKVYEGYLKIIKMYPNGVKMIDASKGVQETFLQVKNEIENILKRRKNF